MKKITRRFFLIGLLFVLLAPAILVFADTGNPLPPGGSSFRFPNPLGEDCTTFECPAGRITSALYQVAIPIVAIMVLVGGFQIMTAGGDPEKFQKGKWTVLYAAIGFVAVLLASGVVSIINSILGG
ncbi:hypothetical protein C4571_02725 [Candidatus Parcubacteria bacterium]|nr:MAG: hypothetical protein C4571_02725 [Candidatus Parcubacteria bacterium]